MSKFFNFLNKPNEILHNFFEKYSQKNKFWKIVVKAFSFSVSDIILCAFLIAMYLILKVILTFTPLRIINIQFEYIFYIVTAFFLNLVPALVAAFLCDFLSLFISGSIGMYHWVYAISPILITLVAFLFFAIFRSKYRLLKYSLPSIIMLGASIAFLVALILQIKSVDSTQNNLISISNTFGFKKVSYWVLYIFFGFFILSTILVLFLSIFGYKKNNKDLFDFAVCISIVVFIVVIFRWIYGPYAYITYYNYLNSNNPNKFKTLGTDYILWMYKIMFKSLFTIPIYIFILVPLMTPFAIIREQYYVSNFKNKY